MTKNKWCPFCNSVDNKKCPQCNFYRKYGEEHSQTVSHKCHKCNKFFKTFDFYGFYPPFGKEICDKCQKRLSSGKNDENESDEEIELQPIPSTQENKGFSSVSNQVQTPIIKRNEPEKKTDCIESSTSPSK